MYKNKINYNEEKKDSSNISQKQFSSKAAFKQKTTAHPNNLRNETLLQLQRIIGNQKVAQLFTRKNQDKIIQKKEKNDTDFSDKIKTKINNISTCNVIQKADGEDIISAHDAFLQLALRPFDIKRLQEYEKFLNYFCGLSILLKKKPLTPFGFAYTLLIIDNDNKIIVNEYDLLKTTRDQANEIIKENRVFPINQEKRKYGVRIIFGRGRKTGGIDAIDESEGEKLLVDPDECNTFIYCESRYFGQTDPSDITVDYNKKELPDSPGSATDIETYIEIFNNLSIKGQKISAVYFENIPPSAWITGSKIDDEKIKNTINGLNLLKLLAADNCKYIIKGAIPFTEQLNKEFPEFVII